MAEIVIRKVQLRRDTRSQWLAQNPVLGPGEPGLETDTNRLKFGNGAARWSDLDYFSGSVSEGPVSGEMTAHINSETPHPVYDDGPSLALLYQNAKV